MTTLPVTAPSDRLERGTILALVAMAVSVFVIANDVTALSVALPNIEQDFDTDVTATQWVINAYSLVFGVLIVTGGRLADLFGRRRLFFIGAAVFAVFSVLAGAAQGVLWLIGCRALMGIGGAIMWPATLGMTFSILPRSKSGLAGGLIIGAAGLGNAAGPLLGGFLTDALSWRWILFLNLPIAALACLITWRTVPESRSDEEERRIDYLGISTLSVGLVALLIALDQATDYGWGDWRIVALFAASAFLLVAFVVVERRAGPGALIPADVARNVEFRSACVAVLLLSATFFAALMYLPQFMQKILDFSALRAGVAFLPLMGTFAAVSFVAGTLYARVGAKPLVSVGSACLAGGMFLLSAIDAGSGYLSLVPGMVVLGLGVALFYSAVTTAGVTAVDESRSGLAGGLVYMCQVGGGSIGLGLTTAVFTTVSQNSLQDAISSAQVPLSESQQDALHGALAGTDSSGQILAQFPGEVGDRLVEYVREAFADGLEWALRMDGALAVAGFLVALFFVGGRLRLRRRRA